MQLSSKIKISILALILAPLGILVVFLDDWRAASQLSIARQALRARDADKALNAASEALRLAPRNGEAHLIMARAFRRKGQLNRVRECLTKASSLGIARDRVRREEWLAMAQMGQMQQARPHLSELLINPGDDGPEICEAFSNGFFLTYQLAEAFQILDVWEKDYPADAQPLVFRAAFSSKGSEWSNTAKYLRRALELEPNRNDIIINLAATLLVMQQTDEAATLIEQARLREPDNPEALVAWAQVLIDRGELGQASATLEHLLQIAPKHIVALRLLGEIHSTAGHFEEALQLFENALAISGRDVKLRYALATTLQRIGRESEAQKHFEFVDRNHTTEQRVQELIAIVRKQNDNVKARFEIAELLREAGEPRDRLLWLRSVVALDPKHKAAHAELAKCYEELGNLEESQKHRLLADDESLLSD